MSCDCIKSIKKRMAEATRKKIGKEVDSVKLENQGFIITDGGLVGSINIPFLIKADATGYRSAKGRRVQMIANYCPFCGEQTEYKMRQSA